MNKSEVKRRLPTIVGMVWLFGRNVKFMETEGTLEKVKNLHTIQIEISTVTTVF